jgi:hypothetical protein
MCVNPGLKSPDHRAATAVGRELQDIGIEKIDQVKSMKRW